MKKHFSKKKYVMFGGALLLLLFCGGLLFPYRFPSPSSVTFLDRDGEVFYRTRNDYRQELFTGLNQIPSFLKTFLVHQEDKRFYSHWGIDVVALVRAMWKTFHGFPQGGSTIDQQVIKLDQKQFQRTFQQKIIEQYTALRMNVWYTKDEILLHYINSVYFPHGIQGYALACQAFFGKTCSQLSPEHFVYLYGISKYPHIAHLSGKLAPLVASYHLDNSFFSGIADQQSWYLSSRMPWYVQSLFDQDLVSGTLVKTDYDPLLSRRIDTLLHQYTPLLHQYSAYDACVIVLEQGHLRSINSLRTYGGSGTYLNPCLSPRQVGSAMKPFLYAYVFATTQLTGGSSLVDEPVSYFSDLGTYAPKNFDLQYHGEVSLAQALGSSLNIPAVKLLDRVGVVPFYQFLRQIAQFTRTRTEWEDDPRSLGLPLALGVKPISPLDFTRMWEVFYRCRDERQLPFCKTYGNAFSRVREILSKNEYRVLSFPLDNWFTAPNTYAKSGTSRNFVDGWVCGGKGQFTVCVWVGNLSTAPLLDAGHNTAGPLWYNVMEML